MFLNLHQHGFLQQSTYARNMLVQPGPLTVPPMERSLDTPSFRIIDFGRGRHIDDHLCNAVGIRAWEEHKKWKEGYEEFIDEVGIAEAKKPYTITMYEEDEGEEDGEGNDKDKKGKGKGKGEVRMVMGLEEDKWNQLETARRNWMFMVSNEKHWAGRTLDTGM
jgi:hypothetical protein